MPLRLERCGCLIVLGCFVVVIVHVSSLQFEPYEDNEGVSGSPEASPHRKSLLSPRASGNKVVSVIRRNTAEFTSSIRDRYRDKGRDVTDRPQITEETLSVETTSYSAARCHSERNSSTSVGIMRRITKKGTAVARSLSFHSHTSEGQFLLCGFPFSFTYLCFL